MQGDPNTRVYLGIIDGEPDYVGIAYDVERRQSQHGDRFDYLREITTEPLTRRQARAIEQAMIKNHPEYSNKINSISSSFSMMLANNGERFPPCGVPTIESSYSSSIMIPLTRYFLIMEITSPSLIVLPIIVISLSSVTDIFNHLYELLGFDNFTKLFPICLADNGTEFSDPFGIEVDSDGVIRSQVFYCDPSSPGQKGACENNHEFIRRIIPKSTDLGQYTQTQINLMMNHINSYGRHELGDKSPYEMFEFYYGKEILDLLGIHKIPANEIILKPELLKYR